MSEMSVWGRARELNAVPLRMVYFLQISKRGPLYINKMHELPVPRRTASGTQPCQQKFSQLVDVALVHCVLGLHWLPGTGSRILSVQSRSKSDFHHRNQSVQLPSQLGLVLKGVPGIEAMTRGMGGSGVLLQVPSWEAKMCVT